MEGKKWSLLQLLLLAAVAFLLGRASILGQLFPFGLALAAATASLDVPWRQRWVLVSLAWLGTAVAAPEAALGAGAAFVSFDLAWHALGMRRADHPAPYAGVAAVAGGLLDQIIMPGALTVSSGMNLCISGLLTTVVAYTFSLGLPHLLNPPRLRAVPLDQLLASGLILLAAISGLGDWPLPGFSLRNLLGTFAVIVLASLGGGPLGAAFGAVFGLFATLGDVVEPATVGMFSFAGLVGGVSRHLGRVGTAIAFIIGHFALVFHAGVPPGGLIGVEAVVAGIATVAMPRSWLSPLSTVLAGASPVIGDARSPQLQVNDGAARRLHELAQVFGELGRAFDQVAVAKARQGRDDGAMAAIYAAVAERACQGCPLARTCWQDDMFPTYSSLRSLWTRVELEGPADPDALGGPLRRRCLRPETVVGTVNYLFDLLRVDRYWEQRVSEARLLVAAQLRGVAQIMDQMADEVRANMTQTAWPTPVRRHARFAYRAGVSRLNKTGSHVSGDSYLIRPLDGGRLLVALSDGMGAGVPAALESRATVTLLERLMETGFGATLTIQTINSILLLRSPEEKFATMDLALFDLWQGQCELIKIGAAPSFIKRGEHVEEWRAPSVPVGILHQIDVETTRRQLGHGDYLIMLSDGLLAAKGTADTAWIQEFLAGCPPVAPQIMSEALLAYALGGQSEVADDMTVIVLRLTEARE